MASIILINKSILVVPKNVRRINPVRNVPVMLPIVARADSVPMVFPDVGIDMSLKRMMYGDTIPRPILAGENKTNDPITVIIRKSVVILNKLENMKTFIGIM